MKRCAAALLAIFFAFCSAQAGQYVLGLNFAITQPTTITAIGARDGGTGFTFTESVGVFDNLTGTVVGSEAVFGPGEKGVQLGDVFFERVPTFVLEPGDYSIVSLNDIGTLPGGGGLVGSDTFANLGNDLNLPEGYRFNFGSDFDPAGSSGPRGQFQPFFLIDLVPDGGATALLLGASLAGLAWARRKF
jgi:hypothetical protein